MEELSSAGELTAETPFVGVDELTEVTVDDPVKVSSRPLIMSHPMRGVISAVQTTMSTEHFLPLAETTIKKVPSNPVIGVPPKA